MSRRKLAEADPRESESEDVMPPEPQADDPANDAPRDVVPLGPTAMLVRRAILIAVLPIFSGFYLWQALGIDVPPRALAVSPRTFPVLIGILMVAVALLLAFAEVRRVLRNRRAALRGEEVPPEVDDDQERITTWRDSWVTLAALIVYVLTFTLLGFFLSTVLFLVGLSNYFAAKHSVKNVIVTVVVGVAFSFAVNLLFVHALSVQLPDGVFSGVM